VQAGTDLFKTHADISYVVFSLSLISEDEFDARGKSHKYSRRGDEGTCVFFFSLGFILFYFLLV
jgi:hypothetical protein